MKRLLLLVFLSGCAASMPTQYAQGMPTAPRAPAFNPTLDAPITVGQPGYAGRPENYPRVPQKRVLPETPVTRREPGIWAASTQEPGLPLLLGTPPLDDDEAASEPDYISDAVSCSSMMERALNMADERDRVDALSVTERRCLAAQLYRTCLDTLETRGAVVTEHLRALVATYEARLCKGVRGTHIDGIRRNATEQYLARIKEMDAKLRGAR